MNGKGGYIYLDLSSVNVPGADAVNIPGIYGALQTADYKPVMIKGKVGTAKVYGYVSVLYQSSVYQLTGTSYDTSSDRPVLFTFSVASDDDVALTLTTIPEEET